MGEVGSARYEPALLPPCLSIRALCYVLFFSDILPADLHSANYNTFEIGIIAAEKSDCNCQLQYKMLLTFLINITFSILLPSKYAWDVSGQCL